MISLTVIRDDGDIPGEDITDPLITNEAMAIQRGRNEIDASAKITPVDIDAIHRTGLETGQTVQVLDALQGATWLGKITSIDIAVEAPSITTTISVERV